MRVPLAVMEGASKPLIEPLMALLARAAAIEWEIQAVPLARMLSMAERGEVLAFGIARTPERERNFVFSDAVLTSYGWLASRQSEDADIKSLDELRGTSVCVMRGATFGSEFDQASTGAFRKEVYGSSLDQGMAMLRAGRCRYLALSSHRGPDPARLRAELRASSGENLSLSALPPPLSARTVQFAAQREQAIAAVLPRLNAAIRQESAAIHQLVNR